MNYSTVNGEQLKYPQCTSSIYAHVPHVLNIQGVQKATDILLFPKIHFVLKTVCNKTFMDQKISSILKILVTSCPSQVKKKKIITIFLRNLAIRFRSESFLVGGCGLTAADMEFPICIFHFHSLQIYLCENIYVYTCVSVSCVIDSYTNFSPRSPSEGNTEKLTSRPCGNVQGLVSRHFGNRQSAQHQTTTFPGLPKLFHPVSEHTVEDILNTVII